MVSLFADEEDDFAADAMAEIDAAEAKEAVELTPKTNPDLIGHETVEQALLADFNAGRLPHAMILAGPQGIGKATLAYRLARFLLSQGGEAGPSLFGEPQKPETLFIPADDPVFRRVASGGHADLLVVEREFDDKKGRLKNDISVETVRRVHPFLRKTAAEGGWRVVIVDSAEYLNASSQNALLKILEEPPRKTVLILTTSQPGSFLPTIRSRCRMIHMDSLSEKNLSVLLDKYAPDIKADEKPSLARLAEGSIGKALQFHQDGGVALYKDLLKNIATLPDLDMVAIHDIAEKIGKYGAERSYEIASEIMTGWCGRLVRLQARDLPIGDILQGDSEIFRRLAGLYPPQHLMNVYERMSTLFRQAENYNLDKKQAIMGAFLMLQRPDYAGPNI